MIEGIKRASTWAQSNSRGITQYYNVIPATIAATQAKEVRDYIKENFPAPPKPPEKKKKRAQMITMFFTPFRRPRITPVAIANPVAPNILVQQPNDLMPPWFPDLWNATLH